MAAQLTLTKGCDDRVDPLWMARATSSFPVPVSPVMRTVESVGATCDTRASTALSGADVPTISSNIDAWSTSSRRARFSARIRRPRSARGPGSPSGSTTTAPIGRRSRNTGSVTMRTWPPSAREPMVCSYPSDFKCKFCHGVAAQSHSSWSSGPKLRSKRIWTSASARALCLPSIAVQVISKVLESPRSRAGTKSEVRSQGSEGSEAEVSGGRKKSRVKEHQE